MTKPDLLIRGALVLTMDPQRRVLRDGWVSVRDGRIEAVGEGAGGSAAEVVEARGRWLLPGFVQGHVHLCQSLFRNHADGLGLLEWLRTRIWPFEAAHDEASMAASARLGAAELIRGGTTAVQDMGSVRHTDAIFEVAAQAGLRLVGGKCHVDAGEHLPHGWRERTADSVAEAEALCRRWHGAEGGRLRYAFAPRFVLSCSDELLEAVAALARERGARLHTHTSESREERAEVRQRFGADNVSVLHRFGYAGRDVSLAHGVWLEEEEVAHLCADGTNLVHCPSANLKLGSGVARVPELLARGVAWSLGADGAPCSNNLDMLAEMRLAALIHKPRAGATAMPALTVLELATLGGARALGLADEVGSVEAGKQADLQLLDMERTHSTPHGPDPYGTIVHSARYGDATDVWIAGRRVLRDGGLETLDEERTRAQAHEEAARVTGVALSGGARYPGGRTGTR